MTVDRTERLLNLVICLLAASAPVPRESIRFLVPGYDSCASDVAFERMFERDKDDLRTLGIPLATVTSDEGEVLGYRITRDDYVLPPVNFSREQWALLGVAARAWSQATLGSPARSALVKLEALKQADLHHSSAYDVITWDTRPSAGEQWLPQFWGAIRQRQQVRFPYRGLRDDSPSDRHVQPWSVVSHDGAWYVIGWDTDRRARRSFRLSRIMGAVVPDGPARGFDMVEHDPMEIISSDAAASEREDAWVALAPGHGGRLRMAAAPVMEPRRGGLGSHDLRRVPHGYDLVHIVDLPRQTLIAAIAELGEFARIISPPSLAMAVSDHLMRVVQAYQLVGIESGDGEASGFADD